MAGGPRRRTSDYLHHLKYIMGRLAGGYDLLRRDDRPRDTPAACVGLRLRGRRGNGQRRQGRQAGGEGPKSHASNLQMYKFYHICDAQRCYSVASAENLV